MKSDSLTREEMLIYLKAFGRYAFEYYEKLDDKALYKEYKNTTNA